MQYIYPKVTEKNRTAAKRQKTDQQQKKTKKDKTVQQQQNITKT
jgi:hypothetical protein